MTCKTRKWASYVAIPCNLVGIVAIVLLAMDPDANLPLALCLLVPMVVALYGTRCGCIYASGNASTDVHESTTVYNRFQGQRGPVRAVRYAFFPGNSIHSRMNMLCRHVRALVGSTSSVAWNASAKTRRFYSSRISSGAASRLSLGLVQDPQRNWRAARRQPAGKPRHRRTDAAPLAPHRIRGRLYKHYGGPGGQSDLGPWHERTAAGQIGRPVLHDCFTIPA